MKFQITLYIAFWKYVYHFYSMTASFKDRFAIMSLLLKAVLYNIEKHYFTHVFERILFWDTMWMFRYYTSSLYIYNNLYFMGDINSRHVLFAVSDG